MDAKTQEILDKIDALCIGVQTCIDKIEKLEKISKELEGMDARVFEHIERAGFREFTEQDKRRSESIIQIHLQPQQDEKK